MIDYLHRVLMGHYGRAELIQPRLLALFEPPQPAPDAIAQRNLSSGLPDIAPVSGGGAVEDGITGQDPAQRSTTPEPVVAASRWPAAPPPEPEAGALSSPRPRPTGAAAYAQQAEPTPSQPRLRASELRTEATALPDPQQQAKPGSNTNATALPDPQQQAKPGPASIPQRVAHLSPRMVTQTAPFMVGHGEGSTNSTSSERAEPQAQTLRAAQVKRSAPSEDAVHLQESRASAPVTPRVSVSAETPIGRLFQPALPQREVVTAEVPPPSAPIAVGGEVRIAPALHVDRAALPAPRQAPPVVRVTIGRVDVHAIVPALMPAPRATPARRAAPLSLDKYLKQVNGQRG